MGWRCHCLFLEAPSPHPILSRGSLWSLSAWGGCAELVSEPRLYPRGAGPQRGLCTIRHESSGPCRGTVTGIYTTSSPEACQYIAHDSHADIIVVDTQEQLGKILKVCGKGVAGKG